MFVRTERLVLRPSWPEDAEAIAGALGHPDVARHLLSAPTPHGIADPARRPEDGRDPRLPRFLAFLRTRGALRLVGGAGIARRTEGTLELGFWVERSLWGLGFATEMAGAVMRVARATGLSRVSSGHFLDNPASASVLRKIGFARTGQVERRRSPARDEAAPFLVWDDHGAIGPRDDMAEELYGDALIAA